MLGVPDVVFSDCFGLGAGGSPKGDRERRAQNNRRPTFEACAARVRPMRVVAVGNELLYGR